MLHSTIALLAVTLATILTALGYILMKRSHETARIKNVSNYFTIEFITGFTITIISGVISVGK